MSNQTERLETLFHAAMELPSAEERGRYLDEAAGDDPVLHRRVEALLKAAEAADAVFQAGREACRLPDILPAVPLTDKPGDRIGRYRLLEKIGEGGMGVVYMAEQEQPVRRKVALKIIKLGMDTRQVIARFEVERQVLALMDHPNIAGVLDGGATEAGRPFFVMELVQGVPITEFSQTSRLSLRQRLQLFLPVCQAIQSAHQKGIIHRDLKPSNVLVTKHNGAPHPMVIDFGVAKAIDQKLTEKTLFTHFATMVGTPAYMSPEQAEMSKLDVDTRSDIYSLGVLLYELLTGTTPFPEDRLRSVAYAVMQRIIAEEEPERPSTRLKAKAISNSEIRNPKSEIDSDLDWIVMKCLEKDRNRRYETANCLAADLNRHLSNEPVLARPPSAAYRLQRTIRRHRIAFAAAAAVALALLGGIAATSWQAVRATRSEQLARKQELIATELAQLAKQQSEIAQAVRNFLTRNLLGGNYRLEAPEEDPLDVDTKQLLALRIARKIEGQFTNQPLVEAEIRSSLYWAFAEIRDVSNVIVQAERVLDIYRRLPGQYSNTLNAIGTLAASKYYNDQKKEAYALLAEAEAAPPPTNGPTGCMACLLKVHGELLHRDGRYGEALVYYKQALTLASQDLGTTNVAVKDVILKMAVATGQAGQLGEAEKLLGDGLHTCERDHGPNNILTDSFRFALGRFLVEQNRGHEAEPLLEQAVTWRQAMLGTNHISALDALCHLGLAYEQQKRVDRAAEIFADIHQRAEKQLPFHTAKFVCDVTAQFFGRHPDLKKETLR